MNLLSVDERLGRTKVTRADALSSGQLWGALVSLSGSVVHCLQDSKQPSFVVSQLIVMSFVAAASIASKTQHSAEPVDALCGSVCEANIRSHESKAESTECKTFLGWQCFARKSSRLNGFHDLVC